MSAYRVAGGLAAALLAALLIWMATYAAAPKPMVLPSVQIGGEPGERTVWVDRSKLLSDRNAAETLPAVARPQEDVVAGGTQAGGSVSNPKQIVQSWKLDKADSQILITPEKRTGTTSLPYRNTNLLEQPQGRDWRRARNGTVVYTGGWLILGVSLALALFLFARGRIRIAEGRSSGTVERFNQVERANHWMTATAFVVLALTGLVVLYGKPLLLPFISPSAFHEVASISAWLHMAASVAFVIGVVAMAWLWLRENLPSRLDVEWLKEGGGFLSDGRHNPPARKFNAGQKIVFWGVTLGGLAALISGVTLMFPFAWLGFDGMQWAQLAHAVIALLMIALIIGHIYIGTVGMEGAIDAMWSGRVDRNWAKEHHSLWYRDISGNWRGPDGTGTEQTSSTHHHHPKAAE